MKGSLFSFVVLLVFNFDVTNAFHQQRLVVTRKGNNMNIETRRKDFQPQQLCSQYGDYRFHTNKYNMRFDDQLDNDIEDFQKRRLHPDITFIHNNDDFFEFLAKDERICVVKFYASWCKTCKKFDFRFKKLALKEADKLNKNGKLVEGGRVRFAEIELQENLRLCHTLGIKKLPFIHYYKAGVGKIDGYKCTPKEFNKVIEDVNRFIDMSEEDIELEKNMREGNALGDSLIQTLTEESNSAVNMKQGKKMI